MQDQLQRIEDKVSAIQIDIAKNTVSLTEHMRRTDASERRIEKLEDWALKLLGALVGGCLLAILGWVGKLLLG